MKGTQIRVVKGDIFEQDVEAIVNPANEHMAHGGGLAGVIARRGGARLWSASSRRSPVPTGSSVITTAGDLTQFKAVIHTVGPIWGARPDSTSDALLSAAHRSALRTADQHGIRSVAFPAVSCGIFGYPVKRAAPIAVRAVKDHLRGSAQPTTVVFVMPGDKEYRAFRRALYPWRPWRWR